MRKPDREALSAAASINEGIKRLGPGAAACKRRSGTRVQGDDGGSLYGLRTYP